MKMEPRFPVHVYFFFFIRICVFCENLDNWQLQRRWVSANFGSTLASPPVLADFNRDGHLDAVILSFDGELILLDATALGEPLRRSDWPAYHHGHHFYAAPILTDFDHDSINEIIICSFDGTIFSYNWKGVLLKSAKLPRFHIQKKLLLAAETELLKILNTAQLEKSESTVELIPEVYSSPVLVDLNNDGRVEELVFAMNYGVLQGNATDKNYNFLLAAGLIFNVTSFTTLIYRFTDLAKRQSEFPPYFLSDPVWFTPPKKMPLVAAANTRGRLYVWKGLRLESVPKFPYVYGPTTQSPCIIWPKGEPLLVILDHSGNVLAINLKTQDVWETTVKGAPTAARRWVTGEKESIVFGTDRGFIYVLDSQTGRPLPDFPINRPNLRFSAAPLIMYVGGNETVALMGQDSDVLVITDLRQPNITHQTSFLGERSHLGPSLLPYKLRDGCSILLPFRDGAVGCYTPQTIFSSGSTSAHRVIELLPYKPLSVFAGANFRIGGADSTLFVYDEVVTLVIHISDQRPSHQYKFKLFLSGSLVHSGELSRSGFHHITFNLLPTDTHGLLLVELQSQLCGTIAHDSIWLHRASFLDRQAAALRLLLMLTCLLAVSVFCYIRRSAIAVWITDLHAFVDHVTLRWRRRMSRREGPMLPLHQTSRTSSRDFFKPLRLLWKLPTNGIRSLRIRFRREHRHRLY